MSKLSNLSDEDALEEQKSPSEPTQRMPPQGDSKKLSITNAELTDLSEEEYLNSSSQSSSEGIKGEAFD